MALEKLKDLGSGVLGVPISAVEETPMAVERLPFLTAGSDLSIPFDTPPRYHWWKGGQSVAATLAEVQARN